MANRRAPSERSVDSRVLDYILQSRQAELDAEADDIEEGEARSPHPSEHSEHENFNRYNYLRGNFEIHRQHPLPGQGAQPRGNEGGGQPPAQVPTPPEQPVPQPAPAPTGPLVPPTTGPLVPPVTGPLVPPTTGPLVPPTTGPLVPPTTGPLVPPTTGPLVPPAPPVQGRPPLGDQDQRADDSTGPRRSQRLLPSSSRSRTRSRSPIRRDRSPTVERRRRSPSPTGNGRLTRQPPGPPKRVVVKGTTQDLGSIMAKGPPSTLCKSLRDEYGVEFEDKSFSLNPPRLDDWMARQLPKEKSARKAVEASEKKWLSAQFKVMDIAPPLLHLFSELEATAPDCPAQRAVAAALTQWGRAFNYISRRRRQNVLNCTAPRLEYLLDSTDSFSTKETLKDLFGKSFLSEMETQRKLDRTFQRLEDPKSASSTSSNQRGKGGGNPRGRGRGRGGRGRGSNSNNSQRYEIVHSPLLPVSENHVGARVKFFVSGWQKITTDAWAIRSVAKGVKIDFVDPPFQSNLPSSVAMTKEMQAVCDLEVDSLLSKKAIIEICDESKGFISSLFVITKKSGGFRPIVNLKPLNSFIRYEHFKMEGLETVKSLIREGDWLVKLDLKDAYLTIPIFSGDQKYLRFIWGGRIFQFTCLPFGLCSAPRSFTKLLKVVVAFFRSRGLRMVIYLDDILLLNQVKDDLLSDLRLVIDTLQALGFLISWDKSMTDPTQCLDYLGVVIDSVKLTFSLPTAKVEEIKSLCTKALTQSNPTLRI